MFAGFDPVSSQEVYYYLNENFEDKESRDLWLSLPAEPPVSWNYMNGGYNNKPPLAFDGDTNAFLRRLDPTPYIRTLVSPPIDLSGARKPQLSFAHAQPVYVFGQDEMRLLFRAGASANWDTIAEYTSDVDSWTNRIFNIDEFGSKYMRSDFYLGFCGKTKSGNGVYIDKVVIEEKDTINKYIKNITVQNVLHNIIPSGVVEIPVLKIYLNVFGNNDSMMLNSITIRSVGGNDEVFENDGFALFATTDDIFRNYKSGISTQVGSKSAVSSGSITFSDLNYKLKTGDNYFWLTADIKPQAAHGTVIDFMVESDAVSVSDTLLPITGINPAGTNRIEESVFFDNFETIKGWTIDDDFEIDEPRGLVAFGSRDPDFAYSGLTVLGTDLTTDGAYRMNIPEGSGYFATTPKIDLKYYIDIKLNAKKWIAFDGLDRASIDVSTDNGATWNSIWLSNIEGLHSESGWNALHITDKINEIANRQKDVFIRFAINYSDNQFAFSGWNIDNFAITGNHLDADVGITRILSPYDGCLGTGNDAVTIVVKNNAEGPSPSKIPVFFGLNGLEGPRVYDTIQGPIPQNDSITFTFSAPANFPAGGIYDKFIVAIDLASDEDPTNDTLTKPLFIQNFITPPHTENFETHRGLWLASENSAWECILPDPSIPENTGSARSWLSSPYGLYANGDTSYISSSCYNLVSTEPLVMELKYWIESEAHKDGMNIQYTTDNGLTWHLVDTSYYGFNWNWYKNNVQALGMKGWSGVVSGWITAREFIPASLLSKPNVKFRAYWASDETGNARGAAFDDFSIIPAPPDIGVVSVNVPETNCLNQNPENVNITIENLGLVNVKSNDTIRVGYTLDAGPTVYDTIITTDILLPGETMNFSFTEKINLTEAKTYSIKAFTLYESNPWFYGYNNDTVTKSFDVLPLPFTGLPDTIQSREPDTVVLRAYYDPGYTYSWEGGLSTADTFKVPGDGVFHLLVTNVGGNGCSNTDSVYVELLFNDIGVDTLISPLSSCELSANEIITMRVKNVGTDSIYAGSNISLSYVLDGRPEVPETLVLDNPLHSGETFLYTFSGHPEDFTSQGSHYLKLKAYYGGDTVRHNDTLTYNVMVYGSPAIDLGGDKVVEALTYTLDAGAGHSSYLWEDGDTNRLHVADQTGLYYVEVVSIHGCVGYDSAFIRLKVRDVSPYRLVSPISACDVTGNVNVHFQVINSGTDTIPKYSKIYVKYQLGTQAIRSDSMTLASSLYPGSTISHIFTNTENLNAYGSYNFMLFATTYKDLNAVNDTLYDTVYLQPKPLVDFGLGESFQYRGLEYMLDAGYGESYNYLWMDGNTGQQYTVTKSGNYSVIVTDSRTGCFAGDTVILFLIIDDVGIASVNNLPDDSCSGDFSDVQVQIRNYGTTNIASGYTLNVGYTLNDVLIGEDAFMLSSVFSAGASITRNLSKTITLSEGSPATLMFYTLLGEDMRHENDTLVKTYGTIRRSPVVDFDDVGGNVMTDVLPYLLAPESGHPSYLWQDGSTASTYNVTSYGTYSVAVTATNGCITSKTVNVIPVTDIRETNGEPFNINIYPNPARDYINLEMDLRDTDDVTIEIYNDDGRLLFNDRITGRIVYKTDINVTHYLQGVYYMRIYNKDRSQIYKIIIY